MKAELSNFCPLGLFVEDLSFFQLCKEEEVSDEDSAKNSSNEENEGSTSFSSERYFKSQKKGKRGNVVAEYWGSEVLAYLITVPLIGRLLVGQMERISLFVIK